MSEGTKQAPRLSARLVFLEDPLVAERLERLAQRDAVSVGAEIRLAVRERLRREELER